MRHEGAAICQPMSALRALPWADISLPLRGALILAASILRKLNYLSSSPCGLTFIASWTHLYRLVESPSSSCGITFIASWNHLHRLVESPSSSCGITFIASWNHLHRLVESPSSPRGCVCPTNVGQCAHEHGMISPRTWDNCPTLVGQEQPLGDELISFVR